MQVFKLNDTWQVFPKKEKSVCVVRYGAYGDMLQAASVFPALKEQGYEYLAVNTTERGADILHGNPHVDALIVQGTNQVLNPVLPEFWKFLGRSFDKLINLSESVERSLLSVQGEKSWDWHKDFRDLVMGVDYLTATHAVADVLNAPKRPFFYPTKREAKWAKEYRAKFGQRNKVIMWALSGSSVHKAYPYADAVIARLMLDRPDVRVVMVGDTLCQILDSAWANEPRVIRKSGKWSIRETLSFLRECDLVIGPETGVLQAAAFEPLPKILMLSHASKSNHIWPQTKHLEPTADCFPCHKLHYGWATCSRDEETGGAACAASINPSDVFDAIMEVV